MCILTIHESKMQFLTGMRYWKEDMKAAFSVALVAIPLSMAISIASGIEPLAGLLSCVVGGFIATIVKSGKLTITGPDAGMITIIFGSIVTLEDGSGMGFQYTLAAIIFSGLVQVLLGVLKWGRLAEIFPSSVIHGLLAAIGVIIFAKQLHVALGTHSDADNTVGVLIDVFKELPHANPYIAAISGLGIILLVFHSKISYRLFHLIPAPVWVLGVSIPIVFLYDYLDKESISILGEPFSKPENYLIYIPENLMDVVVFPDFSATSNPMFWLIVISITLMSSVISLAGAKAVDKLDVEKRKTNLNKEIIGIGITNVVAGCVGALPVLNVIVRSTVNVQNEAKTKWSNFYHGLFVLLFVLTLQPVMNLIPLAALAAVLVYSGYKLASPRVFKNVYQEGVEQLVFMVATLLFTIYNNLLVGLAAGIIITLLTHILIARIPVKEFFFYSFSKGNMELKKAKNQVEIKLKGVSNFLNLLRLLKTFEKVPKGSKVVINFTNVKLIDLTVQEAIDDFRRSLESHEGSLTFKGIEKHVSTTNHKFALKSRISPIVEKLSYRQKKFMEIATQNQWEYLKHQESEFRELEKFHFFDYRTIEQKENIVKQFKDETKQEKVFEISDVTFSEGGLTAKEIYHVTVFKYNLEKQIPEFMMKKEEMVDKFFDRVKVFGQSKDINFEAFPEFSSQYLLRGNDREALEGLFQASLVAHLDKKGIELLESNGKSIIMILHDGLLKSAQIEKEITYFLELKNLF